MKISDIKTTNFRHKIYYLLDNYGQMHPGPERDAISSILSVHTDDGAVGYFLGNTNYFVPACEYEIPKTSSIWPDKIGQLPPEPTTYGSLMTWHKPFLIGMDPFDREKIWQMLGREQRETRNAGGDATVMDMALWDLAGRVTGLPVYKLVGGYRDKVAAYASTMVGDDIPGGLSTPEDYANFAEKCYERGYRAFKIHSWYPPCAGAPDWRKDAECLRAVACRVGSKMTLMVDPWHYYDRYDGLNLAKAAEECGFLWFEEALDEYSHSTYKWVKERVNIPMIGPETAAGKLYTRAEWIASGMSDISRGGFGTVGGFTPLMKCIHLAEAFGVGFELHGPHPAHVHAMCSMSFGGRYLERGLMHPFLNYDGYPPWLKTPVDIMDNEGNCPVSQFPGFGYDFNWDYINDNLV